MHTKISAARVAHANVFHFLQDGDAGPPRSRKPLDEGMESGAVVARSISDNQLTRSAAEGFMCANAFTRLVLAFSLAYRANGQNHDVVDIDPELLSRCGVVAGGRRLRASR